MIVKNASLSSKQYELAILILGLIIGLLSSFTYYNQTVFGDEMYYYSSALTIMEHPIAWIRMPQIGTVESLNAIIQGYTLYIFNGEWKLVMALQVLVYSLTGVVLYRLSKIMLSTKYSAIPVLLYLANNRHWQYIYSMKPAVFVNLFVLLVVYCNVKIIQNPVDRVYYILSGICSALLLLIDFRYLPHITLMYAVITFLVFSRKGKISNLLTMISVMALLMVPWSIRQSVVYKRLVISSDFNEMLIHRALNTRVWKNVAGYDSLAIILQDDSSSRFWGLADSLSLSPGELIAATRQARISSNDDVSTTRFDTTSSSNAGNMMSKSPDHKAGVGPYMQTVMSRAWWFMEPYRVSHRFDPMIKVTYKPASLAANINRVIFYSLLMPLFMAGLIYNVCNKHIAEAIVCATLFISHVTVHAFTYINWRYMLPILPIISVVAVVGLKAVLGRIANKKTGSSAHNTEL